MATGLTALRTALEALAKHPLRAALTGFGILIGVAAVTTVITLGEGAERAVQQRIERMGEDLITVRPRAAEASGAGEEERAFLTEADAKAVAREVTGARQVAPVLQGLVRTVARDKNTSAQAIGTTLAYFEARNYRTEQGEFWSEPAQATSARVCAIGPTVKEELFPRREAVGQSLRIGRHLFRVVAVLEAKGQTPFGMDQDNIVVMPLGAMRSKIAPGRPGEVGQILVLAEKDVGSAKVMADIQSLMRQRHGIQQGQADDFSVRDQSRIANAQRGVVAVMRTLLLSIAGVSLVIGGIGVMNIMLVSVAERSREIGTRLAVGAQAADIMTQFLIEAVVLSLLGGLLGAGLAALLVPALEDYFGWDLALSIRGLAIASTVSVGIGITFGLLPARRAAKLDPVEALRRE